MQLSWIEENQSINNLITKINFMILDDEKLILSGIPNSVKKYIKKLKVWQNVYIQNLHIHWYH